MSKPRRDHPDRDRLLAYAESRLPNAADIVAHMADCPVCAEAVLIIRQVADAERAGLLPPPSVVDAAERDRLRDFLRRPPFAPPTTLSRTSLTALGLLGGAGALATGTDVKPMLAGGPADSGEISGHQPPSTSHSDSDDALDQFLRSAEDVLRDDTGRHDDRSTHATDHVDGTDADWSALPPEDEGPQPEMPFDDAVDDDDPTD